MVLEKQNEEVKSKIHPLLIPPFYLNAIYGKAVNYPLSGFHSVGLTVAFGRNNLPQ